MAAPSLDVRRVASVRAIRGLPAIPTSPGTTHRPDRSRDFWIPQVTQDGQIYYANTLTGELSRDLPPEGDAANGDLASLTSFWSSSRSGTGSGPAFVSRRSLDLGRLEPARIDDIVSTSASRPIDAPRALPIKPLPIPSGPDTAPRPRANTAHASSNQHSDRVPGVLFDSLTASLRNPSHSALDSSSLQPSQRLSDIAEVPRPSHTPPPALLQQLAPPPPDLVSDLLQRARQCIHSVVLHLKQFGIPQVAEDEEIVDNLMCDAITAIRDLLYISGPSFWHLCGRSKDEGSDNDASQSPLVPAQRRAVATLSKFVLSVRAALNDGPWAPSANVSQLSLDAEELERSVSEFVSIAQGVRNQGVLGPRRLHGYLTAPHADPAAPGAGTAGTWKGFGWVNVEDHEEAPRRNLTLVTFNELVDHTSRVQERLSALTEILRATRPAQAVTTSAQELFKALSSLLLFLGDIHIARHVDTETIDQSKLPDGAQYMRTVRKARVLVRSFEATSQAIYDDGASLLVATQHVRRVEPCESWEGRDSAYDALGVLSSSLDFNLKISRQNLEDLMHIGTEQFAILERCHRTPFEWRMSQRTLISAMRANQALEAIHKKNGAHDVTTDKSHKILQPVAEDSNECSSSPLLASPGPPVDVSISAEDDDFMEPVRSPLRPDKIKAFFGDDAPSHYLSALRAEAKPWYLRPRYNHEDILIDPDGTVRGGTTVALVERLTAHEYADTNFTRAFLMTFKSFMTLDKLFNLLVERFWIQPPPDLSSQELEDWRQNKQCIIRIRVINAMRLVIQDEDLVDKEDVGILDRIKEFASLGDVSKIAATKQLLSAIKRARAGSTRKVTLPSTVPPPAPIVPKRIEFLDIDPLELVRQLTITESLLYQKIRPSECLQRSKESRAEYHDGVANFIRRSNRIAHWVTYSILCKDDARRRAAIIKQFISLADRCRIIQNFSAMMAVVTGLNSSPIHRLKRSWEQVGSKYMSQLETCETLINSYKHYNNYRSSLANVAPPCVPFVGVFLTALTHIQEGSKDFLPGDLVNFRKRQKASEVIQDLQRWQNLPHNFHPLPSVLAFIDKSLNEFGDHDPSDVFWKLSLEREPKESPEEKLAKFLSESGFA